MARAGATAPQLSTSRGGHHDGPRVGSRAEGPGAGEAAPPPPHTPPPRVAVRARRRPLEQCPELSRILALARGEVDVRYVGRVVKRALPWHRQRNRPLRIGGPIGHYRDTAGAPGGFGPGPGGGGT